MFWFGLHLPDASRNIPLPAITCSKAHSTTTPKPEARTPLGLTGRRRRAARSPRPAPSGDVTARPLTSRSCPLPCLPISSSGCVSGGDGGLSAGGSTSGGRGVLLLLGGRQVRGRVWARRSKAWRAGPRARLSASPPKAGRECARGRGAGQSRPWAARGARGVGVAAWAPASATAGFIEEKAHLSPLSALSQFGLGFAIPPSSQSPDVEGREGLRRGVLVRVARCELPRPGAGHLPSFR